MLRFDTTHEALGCQVGRRETIASTQSDRRGRSASGQGRNWQTVQAKCQIDH